MEREATEEAEREARRQKERTREREEKEAAQGHRFGGTPPRIPDPKKAVPTPTKQKNFTDPESCLMQDGATGGFIQAYNAQVAVDEHSQVIVACALSSRPNDTYGFLPLLAETERGLGCLPEKVSADAGFYSHAGVREAESRGPQCYIPPQRRAMDPAAQEMRGKLEKPGWR